MSLRINTNIMAINTHRNMQMTDLALSKSLEKLSSGLRVNRASDDAAGLSISENLRTQIRGLAQAERNAQDGISLINTAEGAMNEIHAIMQRMRELAVQSANGTLTTSDRGSVDAEFQALMSEINNIAQYTTFNGMTLINGPATGVTYTFQVGANSGQTLAVNIDPVSTTGLGLGVPNGGGAADAKVTSQNDAASAISMLDTAIATVSSNRSALGAVSNRLEHTINNVAISRENLAAAESRIRDVDMADEMSKLTRAQILMQSGTAMLAQANAQPQNVLSLLR